LGLCKHCGEPVAIGSRRYCLTHWFEKISCDRTGTTKNKDAIRKLIEEQNYLCVYTGKKLVLGENAQLDHKTPPRLGGSNDIENLQWIDAQVNLWKGMRTHEEFVKSCRQIADKFSDQHNLTDTK
jgi:5-methylcytosine-specific restriction endonuclease McrA